MHDSLPGLGDLEREVMDLVWTKGPIAADAVRGLLPRPLKESTIRTVLRRLEEKGYVAHSVEGRTYLFTAKQPRGQVAAKAVSHIVNWLCQGSFEEVFVGMVDAKILDRGQLQSIADKIERAKSRSV